MVDEEWRDVVGFEDRYEVSSLGRVGSKSFLKHCCGRNGPFSFWTKPRILKQNKLDSGYLVVRLYPGDGSKHDILVHRLVATAFIVRTNEELVEVNHKDSDRAHNRAGNLEWVTKSQNSLHGFQSGYHDHKGESHPQSVFSDDDIRTIRRLREGGKSLAAIGRLYGVTYQAISHIVTRKNWSHIE